MRKAFTLVEVMVAVMIISVVIMAILNMRANSINLLEVFKKQNLSEGYVSFLIGHKDFGYEEDRTTLYNLVDDFSLDDELRRELKNIKVDIDYEQTKVIDMSSFDESYGFNTVFEIGNTKLKSDGVMLNILRLKIQ